MKFSWKRNYKEKNRKELTSKKKIYSLLLHNCNTKIEGKIKCMEKYKTIDMNQDGFDIVNIIWSFRHLQDNKNQDAMEAVEI